MPVVYYNAMMAVAYGKSGKEAGLDRQIIKATASEKLVGKKIRQAARYRGLPIVLKLDSGSQKSHISGPSNPRKL